MQLEILFEDNHQIVVFKPAGLLTQPSGTEQESLEAYVKQWIKQKYGKPGNVYLHAVHRIDKSVSGIVLFAKTSKALNRLQEQMREKKTKKIYVATVEGVVEPFEAVLEHFLVHDHYKASISNSKNPDAKRAVLHYRTLSKDASTTTLEIDLVTGRYHQIRVQLAAIGHPIVGDHKYGSRMKYREGAIALCHCRFEIAHPVTGEMQAFESMGDRS